MLLPQTKTKIFRWLKIFGLCYGIIGIVLFYIQDYILFQPVVKPRNEPWQFSIPFAEADLAINNTDTINYVKFLPADSTPRGVILYFHGNKQNIARFARFMPTLTRYGYEVWVPDYPGYGKSIGQRSEKILYAMASQFYKMAIAKYSSNQIIIYGKSLGTGIAAQLAAGHSARQLILETPYYSIPDMFGYYAPIYPAGRMCNYKMNTAENLPYIQYPITIMHGTADGVIPYSHASKLKPLLKPGDRFVTFTGGSHNDLSNFPLFQTTLDTLLGKR
jgi:uncharacterized protein